MRISDWSSDVCSSDLSKYAQPRCREHCADVVLQLESFISQLRIARAEDGIRDEDPLRVILFELGLDRSVTVILRTAGLWRPRAASCMTDIGETGSATCTGRVWPSEEILECGGA